MNNTNVIIRTLGAEKTIEWRDEYRNEDIVQDVFEHCDCIVVPSIWDENSPLVIHEAQQVRVPVITSGYSVISLPSPHTFSFLSFRTRRDVGVR